MVFPETYETVFVHTSQLFGKGTSVEIEVVGHLLSVERDVEFFAVTFKGDKIQVRSDSRSGVFGGGTYDTLRKGEVFFRRNGKQIEKKSHVPFF